MRYVSGEEIRRTLDFPYLIDCFAAAHRRSRAEHKDLFLGPEKALYFVRNAVAPGEAYGSKLITVFPDNPGTPRPGGSLPTVQALFVLFDGSDGRPRAVLDGTEITYWKTAADSGLGARLLAPAEPSVLLMAGTGAMAPWLVRAHRAVRPSLELVILWNRTPATAERLAAELAPMGIAAVATTDLERAAREADVVCCATRTKAPLIKGAWLKPGCHLDLVGGFTPTTREADDEAARRARIFVDSRHSAFDGVGDILQPIASGAIKESDVLADLYDLAQGAPGRRSAGEITFFKNAGGAHLDLMTAQAILARLDGA